MVRHEDYARRRARRLRPGRRRARARRPPRRRRPQDGASCAPRSPSCWPPGSRSSRSAWATRRCATSSGIPLAFKDIVFQGTQSPVRARRPHRAGGLLQHLRGPASAPGTALPAGRRASRPTRTPATCTRCAGRTSAGIQFHAESILTEHGYDLLHDARGRAPAPGEPECASPGRARWRLPPAPSGPPMAARARSRTSWWSTTTTPTPGTWCTWSPRSPGAARGSSSTTRSSPTTCCATPTSCSRPARAAPTSPPTSRSGREVLLRRHPAGARRLPGHAGPGHDVRRARSAAGAPAHGQVSLVNHDGLGVFAGLPQHFGAVRYHSLAAARPARVPGSPPRAPGPTEQPWVVMGVRHRELPLEGVQFHPESILSEHGARDGRQLPGGLVTGDRGPGELVAEVAAAHPRCFWLDGGGAREWSGRRSLLGWLEPDDVSLTYDAAAARCTRHATAPATVVGDDVFAVLEAELAAGDRGRPVVRLPRPRRPPRPARPPPAPATCPTRSGCGPRTCGCSTTPRPAATRRRPAAPAGTRRTRPPTRRCRRTTPRRSRGSRSSCTPATPTRST